MNGFRAFLWKEFVEIRRTWRIWMIPGMLVFFGVTSPIIAALTPGLVRSMTASQPGVVIHIPPPTALDGYAQLLKNLNQFVLIALIISGASAVSSERSSGTAILALTKPLSRRAFVLAKILSQVTLLIFATALGAAACLVVTGVVFGVSHPARVATALALWLLYATLLIVVMTIFSSAFRSRGAAAGAGLAFYFLALLLSAWGPAGRYSFVGLTSAMRDALMGEAVSSGWPVATAVAAIVVGVVAALGTFERQEL